MARPVPTFWQNEGLDNLKRVGNPGKERHLTFGVQGGKNVQCCTWPVQRRRLGWTTIIISCPAKPKPPSGGAVDGSEAEQKTPGLTNSQSSSRCWRLRIGAGAFQVFKFPVGPRKRSSAAERPEAVESTEEWTRGEAGDLRRG